jgi:ribonucleoside-triphosphate reductase
MYNFRVVKRNGRVQEFDKAKIKNAILQSMKFGSGIYKPAIADAIADEIESYYVEKFKDKINPYMQNNIEMSDIETRVFEKLVAKKQKLTAKAYEGYRAIQEFKRQYTTLDKDIEGIVDGTNKDAIDENSNKNSYIASTQRDLIAGEYSRDYSRRHLLPENILHAHDEGMIHMHDLDYFLQHIHNCCLVNLKDMLQNGTVINRKLIETPHTLRTACTIATQIVQQIANGQYGGQTISLAHLAPFVRKSYERYYNKYINRGESEENARKYADEDIKSEIKDGIQTIQYQINTFSTSNGQAPFLSVFMYISEEPEYEKETAMLIEEMLNQRITGMKNEVGAYITPAFPKLLYVTDENNIYPGSEYYYLTELAAKCVSKRMLPDFISAKIMREQYDGEVFPCMGCRSFLQPYKDPKTGKYKWYGRFNQGVVTLNLADVGLSADKDIESFWSILDERLELCFQALMLRHERLLDSSINISPIHWKYGGLSRLSTDNFNELLFNDYSSISLGYAGLYECVKSLIGKSHTTKEGKALGLEIMKHLKETCDKWKKETNIGFSLYGTPLESTTYKLAKCLKKRFGDDVFIKLDGQDRDYITNSYHVNVAEEIEAKDKLLFEAEFQKYSSGGCISYVETCNLSSNIDVIIDLIQFMYENIRYAELNGKFDYCQECGYEGEILLDDNNQWYCPNCGNRNHNTMNVARRTCGYIGDNFWNEGRTDEIKNRYVHVDNKEANIELDEE